MLKLSHIRKFHTYDFFHECPPEKVRFVGPRLAPSFADESFE